MDRILFIVPIPISYEEFVHPESNAKTVPKENGRFGSVLTDMPLGPLSMSAYLKKHVDVETKLIDFNIVLNQMSRFDYPDFPSLFRDVLKKEAGFDPTIIGISSLFSPTYRHLLDIGQICHELFPKAIILGGGGVPTNAYKEIFRDSDCFDALCSGEGELPMLRLVQAPDKIVQLGIDHSWITSGKVMAGMTNFTQSFVGDLNEIPFYDYDLCEMNAYALNPAIVAYASVDNRQESNFHVMTSRGCPFHCCFCASHTVHGRSMRYYSVDRVKEDFNRLVSQFNAKTLVFQDDHFLQDASRAMEIIEFVKTLPVKAIFQNGLALYRLTRPMLEALYSAGLRQLVLAVESGSQRVLKDIMHKPLKLDMIKPVAADCRDLGIYMDINILIGLPGETKQDIEDARQFLRTIDANWFRITVATPLVGSEMFHICQEKGYMKGDYLACHYKKPIVETEDFDAAYIREIAYTLNLELNFVYNSDVRLGNYELALKGFENAIEAKPDHLLAFYYASLCYRKLGQSEKADAYLAKARESAEQSSFWRECAERYHIIL